ncbi:hypothetical protein [Sphaerisporangium fuscum]|uniref:hypothetical protein n=1 Tax=Sphaerisporangium fuscum TaxID=2835868 RepID=UPI001BDBDF04|nr:hypothetical protein [Sphaerisporangium fuscum]
MSDNGSSGFAYQGFNPDKTNGWPGLEVKDGVDVRHSSVKNLLKALEDDLAELQDVKPGTLAHFKVYGKVTPAQMGDWDVAQDMHAVFDQGFNSLATSIEKCIAQHAAALQVARAAFENTGKADDASTIRKQTEA